MSDQEARHKKGAEKAKEDEEKLDDKEKATEVEKMGKGTEKEVHDEKARRKEEIKKKRKIKKKSGNDKLVCKDGVTNLLQFLDEKLSIRAAEPEEQTAEAFNGRKFEKRRKIGMGRRELPFSPKLQVVMSTPPGFPIKTGEMGEPNIMTANVTSYLWLY